MDIPEQTDPSDGAGLEHLSRPEIPADVAPLMEQDFANTAYLLYTCNNKTTFHDDPQIAMNSIKVFDPGKSIRRAKRNKALGKKWSIAVSKGEYAWSSRMDRIEMIRKRLPYEAIEIISSKANLPVKRLLQLLDMPQTTYNKRRKAQELLSSRDSEIVLVLVELLDYGLAVFNGEGDKFYRWLKKPNISLGGIPPESLFDSLTGIQEVKNSLTRLEFGNLA